jgi:hypothetical protein
MAEGANENIDSANVMILSVSILLESMALLGDYTSENRPLQRVKSNRTRNCILGDRFYRIGYTFLAAVASEILAVRGLKSKMNQLLA